MKLDEVLYVLALVACALLATATEQCGPLPSGSGDAAGEASDDDAGPDAWGVCYAPSTPLRAYACDTEANCSTCPAGCTPHDVDAGPGECKP